MIYGIGTDIVDIKRIAHILKKNREGFVKRVLTEHEQLLFANKADSPAFFAKRFAAKEAFSKALGTGFRFDLNFKDIEVFNDKMGKPYYVKNKKITKIVQKKYKVKNFNCFLSISDEKDYSTAFAIIQSK